VIPQIAILNTIFLKSVKMINHLTKVGKKNLPSILMASILALFFGCNSNHSSDVKSPISKSIIEILISEDQESWNCTIKGNKSLTFTAINQISPIGMLFYFPDTTLDIAKTVQIPPNNEIVSSIQAGEFIDGDTTNSRISIVLKMDRPYSISPDKNGLIVSFPKSPGPQIDNDVKKKLTSEGNEPRIGKHDFPPASRLKTVTATPLKNSLLVNVNADGIISDYKTFAIENPARIVFDIYNIKSPYNKEQTVSVESRWVKQIRYFAYSDKIRLVLDTHQDFLTNYFSFPTSSGLLIYVGQIPEPLT
jgi:hypothetical protein